MTFEDWMKDVGDAVLEMSGPYVDDLPDRPYREWYDEGLPPDEAAMAALGPEHL